MLDFCGPLQTHFAQTVHGPQSIAVFPVLSACNNLFTRDTADGCAALLAKSKGSRVWNRFCNKRWLAGNRSNTGNHGRILW